jgi:hypothetical protein
VSNVSQIRSDASASWPVGHIGWVFAGTPSFEGSVARFLAEGLPRGELLMCVAEDPGADRWPTALLRDGRLVVASVAEVYGVDRVVDAGEQHRTYTAWLDEAMADGFKGIRLAADSTSLVATPERLQAWTTWEQVADRFMAKNPFTGLCAFDRYRVEAEALSAVIDLHSVTRAP